MRKQIALILSKFLRLIAIGVVGFVTVSVIGVFQASGNGSGFRIAAYAGIATAFVTYWALEFSRRFFFQIDILEEAATKGETFIDDEFDSRVQAALKRKREADATESQEK